MTVHELVFKKCFNTRPAVPKLARQFAHAMLMFSGSKAVKLKFTANINTPNSDSFGIFFLLKYHIN